MRKYFSISLVVLALVLAFHTIAVAQTDGVSDARFARLAKGVNITRWFWLTLNGSDDHYQNYVSDEELQQLHDAGFTYVRLPIEPKALLNESHPTQLDPKLMGYLQTAVERITAHDLAVIIDVHNWQPDFNQRLMTHEATQKAFAEMWGALAGAFSSSDPDTVFFEVLSEPFPDDPSLWPPVQEQAAKAIRKAAPEHTIIVGGAPWNSLDGLMLLKPLDDANIIYNFHFYDPFVFTHQGASWAGIISALHDIPYPSTNGRCGELPDFGDKTVNNLMNAYCTSDTWDAQTIDQRIQSVVNWAKQYGLRLTCNEFGVNPPVAPPDDRLQWFTDVRTTLEKYNIGWALWGYDDALGFGYQPDKGLSDLNPQLLQALGLSQK